MPVSQRRMEARLSMINTVVNGFKLPSYFIKNTGRRNGYQGANPFFHPVEAKSCGALVDMQYDLQIFINLGSRTSTYKHSFLYGLRTMKACLQGNCGKRLRDLLRSLSLKMLCEATQRMPILISNDFYRFILLMMMMIIIIITHIRSDRIKLTPFLLK